MKKYFVVLALLILFGVGAQRTAAQNPSFTGSFEVADCRTISGWAFDSNNLNTSVHVNFFVGSTLLAMPITETPLSKRRML